MKCSSKVQNNDTCFFTQNNNGFIFLFFLFRVCTTTRRRLQTIQANILYHSNRSLYKLHAFTWRYFACSHNNGKIRVSHIDEALFVDKKKYRSKPALAWNFVFITAIVLRGKTTNSSWFTVFNFTLPVKGRTEQNLKLASIIKKWYSQRKLIFVMIPDECQAMYFLDSGFAEFVHNATTLLLVETVI